MKGTLIEIAIQGGLATALIGGYGMGSEGLQNVFSALGWLTVVFGILYLFVSDEEIRKAAKKSAVRGGWSYVTRALIGVGAIYFGMLWLGSLLVVLSITSHQQTQKAFRPA